MDEQVEGFAADLAIWASENPDEAALVLAPPKPEPREPQVIQGKNPTERNRALLGRALRKGSTP